MLLRRPCLSLWYFETLHTTDNIKYFAELTEYDNITED